jgi:hypothetical protein
MRKSDGCVRILLSGPLHEHIIVFDNVDGSE